MAKIALPRSIPTGPWDAHTAEAIQQNFERIYGATGRLGSPAVAAAVSALLNGLDGLVPAVGDLIVCTSAGAFTLLPIVGTAQRALTNNGGAPTWAQINLATGVTSKLVYANIQDVTATARFLGRITAGAGVIEELTPANALSILGVGASIYTGNGHPQGVLSASVGAYYQDLTAPSYNYRKLGGGSTAYGWYLDLPNAGIGQMGPQGFAQVYSGIRAATGSAGFNGYGYFMGSVLDGVDFYAATGVTTYAHAFVSGKLFKTITSSGAAAPVNTYLAGTTNPRQPLDDDLDLWFEFRTGSDITSIRIWAGITNSVITDSETFSTSGQGSILFRYSTAAGDGGWIGQTAKNGAANHSETATVATIAANTTYKLRIRYLVSGHAYFSVNDSTELELTTNLPPTGNTYFPIWGFTQLTNAARTVGIRGVAGWQGS